MNAKEIIGHKIGPLPLGAWALIGMGGVAVLYFLYARSSGTTASPAAGPIAAPAAGSADALTLALEDLSQSLGQIGQAGAATAGTGAAGASPVPANNGFGATPLTPIDIGKFWNGQPPALVTGSMGGGFITSQPGGGDILGFIKATGESLPILGQEVTGPVYSGSTSPGLVGVASGKYIPVDFHGTPGFIWAPEAKVSG